MTAIATTTRKPKPVLNAIKPRDNTKRAWACTLRAAAVIKKRLLELGGREYNNGNQYSRPSQLAIEFDVANGLGVLRFHISESLDNVGNTCAMFGRFETATQAQLENLALHGVIPGCNPISGKWNHFMYLTQYEVDMLLQRLTIWLPQITGIERPEVFETPQF